LLDEIAFWPTEEGSGKPDIEVIDAIKPGMATIPKAMLLCGPDQGRQEKKSAQVLVCVAIN
jgi:hypothetical protein